VLGWDDNCPGLVGMLAREVEWKACEDHSDSEAAHWEVDPPDDWGNTPPVNPNHKGSGDWPSQEVLINVEVTVVASFPTGYLSY
jgi:hypothetical protein